MRKSCIAVGLLLAFLFVPHARGQKNTGGNSVEEIKLVVFATFGREVVRLKSFADVSPNEIRAVREAAGKTLHQAIEQRVRPKGADAYDWGQIPPDVFEKLQVIFKSQIDDQPGVKAYLDDLALRQRFEQEGAVDHLVCTLDRGVGLSTVQIEQLVPLAENMVRTGRLAVPSLEGGGFSSPTDVLEPLKKLLSEDQIDSWNLNGEEALRRTNVFDARTSDSMENRRAQLTRQLKAIANARINQLKQDLDLPPEQVRKLQVAAKGTYYALVRQRLNAEDRYQSIKSRGQTPSPNTDNARLARSSRISLFHGYSRWPSLLRSTLTEDQWERVQTLYDERYVRGARRTATSMMLSMCDGMSLRGIQQLELRDLFVQHMPSRPRKRRQFSNMFPQYKPLLALPDEDYINIVGEDNWPDLQRTLDYYREYFAREPVELEEEEDTDDAGE